MSSLLAKLYDADTWIVNGEEVKIEQLEKDHVRNIIGWLQRNAEELKLENEWLTVICIGPQGEQASMDFETGFDRLLEQSAIEWLEETPLMVRLRELLEDLE